MLIGRPAVEQGSDELQIDVLPFPQAEHRIQLLPERAAVAGEMSVETRIAQERRWLRLAVVVVDQLERARWQKTEAEGAGDDVEIRELGIEQRSVCLKARDAAEAISVELEPGLAEGPVGAVSGTRITGAEGIGDGQRRAPRQARRPRGAQIEACPVHRPRPDARHVAATFMALRRFRVERGLVAAHPRTVEEIVELARRSGRYPARGAAAEPHEIRVARVVAV